MEKVALITGASKGIGKGLAHVFAKNGFNLLLIARNTSELAQLRDDLKAKYQCQAKILSVDLAQKDAIDIIMNTFQDEVKKLDVLVNNAGFGHAGKFHLTPASEAAGMVEVNIGALTMLTYRILPFMLARKQGKILNIASTGAFAPGAYMAEYYASKSYVLSFTRALREEYRKEGINFTAVCPGFTPTEFAKRAGTDKSFLPSLSPNTSIEHVAQASYQGLMNNRAVVVPGVMNKILRFLMWLSPAFIVVKITGMLDKPKT